MNLLARHHWTSEQIITLVVIAGLTLGAGVGFILGDYMGNTGVGISLGVLGGLIIGVVAGLLISDHIE